ncbi:histidine kinase [Leptolyngbya sp. 'hensonii']|nr:histidine kinase [Leptolyngbya sp. 'hensonii']
MDSPLRWAPDLNAAIERTPLIVSPETLLVDVITLISQTHHRTCTLDGVEQSTHSDPLSDNFKRQAGCVLVIQDGQLKGILTERDVVRWTATGMNFAGVQVSKVMVHPVITVSQRSLQDIFAVLFLFRRYRIRNVPVVDDTERVIGVISHSSLRQALRPANLLRLYRVADVMTTQVVQAPLSTPVLQVAQLMATQRVSCVVITQFDDENNSRPVGIVTERDIVQFQALQIDLSHTMAERVMSTPLFLLNPEDSLWTAQQEMQKRHVGRLVVSWNWGRKMGILTQTSLLRVFDPVEMYSVIKNLQQTIQQLETEKELQQSLATLKGKTSQALQQMLVILNRLLEQSDLQTPDTRSQLQQIRDQLTTLMR